MVELNLPFPLITFIILLLEISTIVSFKFNIPEDARLNFTELGRKYGKVVEEHDVTTEDGYILKLFNIPGNKSKPVLFIHGILDTGDTFILRGNSSLSVNVFNAGYDVWVANTRGGKYSRRHNTLDPDFDGSFWDFSFHEIGYYDLPALIDYVLANTGVTNLSAVGHSLGNSIFYVLGATRPEYNYKIKVLIALGPVCYANNYKFPLSGVIAIGFEINKLLLLFREEEVLSEKSIITIALKKLCTKEMIGYKVCANVMFSVAGYDVDELEPKMYYIAMGHFPKSVSRKTLLHFLQVARRSSFSQFDYGPVRNLKLYNSREPPNYDLGKVTMKVALFVGKNDKLTPIEDVRRLARELPNLVELKIFKDKKINHIDLVWGRNMKVFLFPHVLRLLGEYS